MIRSPQAFFRRHAEIAGRTIEPASFCVSEADIRKWFDEVQEYIKEEKLEEAIKICLIRSILSWLQKKM
jgi:hypothetical protein